VSELLERERELAVLDRLAAEARAGAGRLVVIEATAGLGKTRLLQAARESARRQGMHVLAARATELEQGFPFALAYQLFEPALTALDPDERDALLDTGAVAPARGALGLARDGAEPPPDTFAVLHGLYWLTAAFAERQPLLLAVDDAHWADAASLDLLAFLAPRLEELPVLLAIACRPDEPGAEAGLARIATDASAQRLAPRPLSAAGAAALVAETLQRPPADAFAAICHEVSGGNPFLLRELARTLADEAVDPTAEQAARVRETVPERVARTVGLRLARLSPAARAVARAVVVLGDGADGRLVAELTELDEAEVVAGADALRAAAILDQEVALRFVHPLVRTALEAELPTGERTAAHARAVALLRARGASPLRLATHLAETEARGDRATAETLLEAARAALAGGAPGAASAYLTRALREPAPGDLRPAILDALITAGIRSSDAGLLRAIRPELLAELDRDPDLLVRTANRISTWMLLSGQAGAGIRLLKRAIETAAARGNAERAFHLEAQLGAVLWRPLEEGRTRLVPYVDDIPPDSSSGRLAAALEAEWHVYDGTAAAAVDAARRALGCGGAIFVEQPETFAPGRAVLALMYADALQDARRAADQAVAHARRRNATPELVAAWWISSGVEWTYGDLAAAEADIHQALDVAQLGGLWFGVGPMRAVLACLLVQRGELLGAEEQLEGAGMLDAMADRGWAAIGRFPRGMLRFEQGRFAEAAEDFVVLERLAAAWGVIGMPAPPARVLAARALAAAGDLDGARVRATAALEHARRFGAPSLLSRSLRAQAMTADDGPERLAALTEAVAVLEGSPARLARAEALAELGIALRRARRDVDARPPLREALELARRCGATGLAKQAFDELAATGERARRYTPIGAESLTPSQRRVVELAAGGMTNRQIAQSLFLTVKTIESHLAAAYDTLGVRSRQELPGALGPTAPTAPARSAAPPRSR
jgi:DNA-binding NarL/FixJ family response regulator